MEKEIKIIKSVIYNQNGKQMNYIDIDNITPDEECKTFITAIEHLIKAYKELEEENKKLKQLKEKHNVRINDLCSLVDNFEYNSIPVSLVEEKIEELDIKITYIESQYTNGGQNCDRNYLGALYQKQVLQELLEKRK